MLSNKFNALLDWLEKKLKTDIRYILGGMSWLTLGQIVSSASAFLLAIAFANLLPKETFGTYRYILSIASILTIPTLGGMNTALTQAVARGYEGSVIPALKTKIRWGVLGGIASLAVSLYYYLQGNLDLTLAFLLISAFIPLMDSFSIYNSYLNGKKLFGTSTQFHIISQLISVASLIAVLFLTKNILFILLAYFLPWTLARFIFLKITLKKFPPNEKKDESTVSYGKQLSGIGILGTVASYFDHVLLFHFLGPTKVAIYSFAIVMPEQIKAFLKFVGGVAFPKFSQRIIPEIRKTIWRRIFLYFLFLIIIVIIYIVLAPFIFELFFPAYLESLKYSQLYAVSLVVAPMILYTVLVAHKKIKEIYIFNIINALLLISFLLIGTVYYGLWGIILARIAHRFLLGLIVIILFQKLK